ncbi:MAG TPA: DUF3300 domain-containing protein, partial [Tepidisphaeraceae bacterium]|nr:DUF3300 domain-containing protein [Tepidisphaeraceae bacterium]
MQMKTRGLVVRLIGSGLLCVAVAGCTVHMDSPPRYYAHRYYYRTRVVYTASGPVYVRERVYYDEPVYGPAPAYTAPPPASAAPVPVESAAAAQLHPLVAPIALYPDPLVAIVLPASTYSQQVQDANAFLAARPLPPQPEIDAQPWDPAVKALVHYPTVLAQLARDPSWTQSLGAAYLNQPGDVMAAIQQLRAQALAEGNLRDTPQTVVVQD